MDDDDDGDDIHRVSESCRGDSGENTGNVISRNSSFVQMTGKTENLVKEHWKQEIKHG